MTSVAYPRPDFDRSHHWQPLNGPWDFAPDPNDHGLAEQWHDPGHATWSHQIIVPFAWETPASGITMPWMPIGWYHRHVTSKLAWQGQRIMLHFGAVHYHCTVWANGQLLGEHTGGYLPFAFDVTDTLSDNSAEIVVRVVAPLDKRDIPHGKQRSQPVDDYDDCAFTASSGIWQTVWLEPRPATFIEGLELRPTTTLDAIAAKITIGGILVSDATLTLQVAEQPPVTVALHGAAQIEVHLPIMHPQRWSPESPTLYTVQAHLDSPDGRDSVTSYTGLRAIQVVGDQIHLNGERIFLRGVLDQGYWPETGYTAPDDAALRQDVELALQAGYNLVRKHIKLEDPLWLYWADRLGLLVWEEPPCTGRFSPTAIATFLDQVPPMVARDGNHPCIIMWGLYNEEWGLDWQSGTDAQRQAAVERAYDCLAACDRSRPIIDDSGWWHVKTDIVDWHYYNDDMRQWSTTTAALAHDHDTWFGHRLSDTRWYETRLSITGRDHAHLPLMNGEYGGGASLAEQGWLLRWQTADLRRHDAFCGYIYTELYDVENEVIGIYDAQRRLKALGCDPATINATTILLFDLIPEAPGCDYRAHDQQVTLTARLSHHGKEAITGQVAWGWRFDVPQGQTTVTVQPFQVSEPLALTCALPGDQQQGTLQVWFADMDGQRHALATLDVALALAVGAEIGSVGTKEVRSPDN